MSTRNSLEAWWMPFTANRRFKAAPRMIVAAQGMYYRSEDGREILDGVSGLWCCAAGHDRPKIAEAIRRQLGELDYAPGFQMGHPIAFELANRLIEVTPEAFQHVVFTNSGSEAVDTALKLALGWHRARGEGQRVRLIGRERGYHGVNFGGAAVGGMGPNRAVSGALVAGVDHIRQTGGIAANRFSRGQPAYGVELADDLERLCALHDPSTIAAVIVEPVAGSAGVLVPPVGYLKRLREICDRHGILLIFDEVITGFGRLGAPFAADFFAVIPDLITVAKAMTNGVIPMGAVFTTSRVQEAFMQGPPGAIEFMHGYTTSGSPLACAAALGTLDTYQEEGLFTRAARLEPAWSEALHGLADARHVIDVRDIGLMGAIELAPHSEGAGRRGLEAIQGAWDAGLLIRVTGDTIALAPPLIVSEDEIARMVDIVRLTLSRID